MNDHLLAVCFTSTSAPFLENINNTRFNDAAFLDFQSVPYGSDYDLMNYIASAMHFDTRYEE